MKKDNTAKIKELILNFSEGETYDIGQRKNRLFIDLNSYEEMLIFIKNGHAKIIEAFTRQNDQQALSELQEGANKLYDLFYKQTESADIESFFSQEQPLASTLGYSNNLLEKIYQIGVHYYQNHQLSDASHVLALLNLLDSTHFSAWLSLGVVLEQEKKWEQSLEALKVACQLDSHNPIPHVHEAICFGHLGKKQEANSEFQIALKLANEQPSTYAGLKGDIQREKEKLLRS